MKKLWQNYFNKNFSIKKGSLSSILRKTNILNFHLAKKIIGLIHDDENKILKLIKKNKIKWAKKIYYEIILRSCMKLN